MTDDTLSFAKDIRPMFTEIDVAHMQGAGIDLSSRDDCEKYALAIYTTVSDGSMPPPGTGETWSKEMCERFKTWWDQGCKP
jgi:hypothetical protein